MKISYKYNRKIPPKQLLDLYKSVNWTDKNDIKDGGKTISKTYRSSQLVISSWDGKQLIGTIRAITDGTYNGVIFGLAVNPRYQKQGIGTNLIKKCTKTHPKLRWYLGADDSKTEKFYKKIGLKQEKAKWFHKYPQDILN